MRMVKLRQDGKKSKDIENIHFFFLYEEFLFKCNTKKKKKKNSNFHLKTENSSFNKKKKKNNEMSENSRLQYF